MISVLNLAKNSCRGVLFKTLSTKSQTIGSYSNVPKLFPKPNNSQTYKSTSLFSTSQYVSNVDSHSDHSHSKTWTAERFLSAGLLGILPLTIAFPTPLLDYSLALALTAHVHWGVEAIVVDYIRPNVVGAALAKAAIAVVYALSVFTLGGLFYFNYSDVGLGQAIRLLWKL